MTTRSFPIRVLLFKDFTSSPFLKVTLVPFFGHTIFGLIFVTSTTWPRASELTSYLNRIILFWFQNNLLFQLLCGSPMGDWGSGAYIFRKVLPFQIKVMLLRSLILCLSSTTVLLFLKKKQKFLFSWWFLFVYLEINISVFLIIFICLFSNEHVGIADNWWENYN